MKHAKTYTGKSMVDANSVRFIINTTGMKKSAGILLFNQAGKQTEVLLVHPGGPFWKSKDLGSWSVPKGEVTDNEEALAAAIREFEEELGSKPAGNFIPLKPVKQKSGKLVYAWALEGILHTENIKSNLVNMEWPPGSGKIIVFPEVDKAAWFSFTEAKKKINAGQIPLLDELTSIIKK